MKKIITTVGTSLIKNQKSNSELQKVFNRKEGNIDEDDLENLDDELKILQYNENRNLSAELSSITQIILEDENPDTTYEIYLLATDTQLSPIIAKFICDWLKKRKEKYRISSVHFDEAIDKIDGLKIDDPVIFKEKGVHQLFNRLNRIVGKNGKNAIINITGGYKALVPVMTIYGQLYGAEIRYLYKEDTEQLEGKKVINLPSFPLNFDWNVGELYSDFLQDEKLRSRLENNNDILKTLRDYGLIETSSRNLTLVGTLMNKYIDEKMEKGKTTFGYFVEYKVYEYFIQNPYSYFTKIPLRSKSYWWSKSDRKSYAEDPMFNKDKNLEEEIELDIVLSNVEGKEIWCEIKSFSKTGLKKAYKQIKTRLEFNQMALENEVPFFFLILYKFILSELKVNQQIKNITDLFKGSKTELMIWYLDVPVFIEKEKINHKNFFAKDILLKQFKYL